MRSISRNRPKLCRAATNPRQCATASSIGNNARDVMIEQAIITPGDISYE